MSGMHPGRDWKCDRNGGCISSEGALAAGNPLNPVKETCRMAARKKGRV